MTSDFNQNDFALFGLEPGFAIDMAKLEQAYRELQSAVHPDRFASQPDTERRLSMQWATRVNEAYRTLKAPLARARYWLHLHGTDVGAENNTAMPPAFLMEQMEWREAVEEARAGADIEELDALHRRLRQQMDAVLAELGQHIDTAPDGAKAAETVRRAMFLEKLHQEIDEALEALES